jgi:hypothetical protein
MGFNERNIVLTNIFKKRGVMMHSCTLKCVRAENLIKEQCNQLALLKSKLRKKNIYIVELEKLVADFKRREAGVKKGEAK